MSSMVLVMHLNNLTRELPLILSWHNYLHSIDSFREMVASRIVRSRMSKRVTGQVLWDLLEYKINHKVDVTHSLRFPFAVKPFILARILGR